MVHVLGNSGSDASDLVWLNVFDIGEMAQSLQSRAVNVPVNTHQISVGMLASCEGTQSPTCVSVEEFGVPRWMGDLAFTANPVKDPCVDVVEMLSLVSSRLEFHDVRMLLDGALGSGNLDTGLRGRHTDVVNESAISYSLDTGLPFVLLSIR